METTEAVGQSAVPEQSQTQRRRTVVTSGESEYVEEEERKLSVTSSSPIIEIFEGPEGAGGFRYDDIDEKTFTCSYCGRKFARRQTLEQHERIHTGEKPFRCSDCNKCFRQRSALRVHRKGHTGDKAFVCFVCCKRFYRSGDLKAHLGIHTGVREHNCLICSKGFGRPSDLRRHMQTHEAERVLVDMAKSPHECSRCGKKFTRRAQVEVHQRVHTGEKPYRCSRCGENFRWRQNFKAHQRNHTCEKPYQCSDCDKRFTGLSALEKHQVMLHSGVVPRDTQCHHGTYKEDSRHRCCQCGKSFNQAKDLVVHQRVHTGEKPYKCSQCEKRFRQIGHLKEHQRVHSGEKPYQCSVCYKCFPYSQSMKKHMRVIHGAYQCNTKEKSFSLMDDVEVVKIGSAPSSPSSRHTDVPGAFDILRHIRIEDICLPFVKGAEVSLATVSKCPKYSGVTDECSQNVKSEEDFPLEEDVEEVHVCSVPSSPATKLNEDRVAHLGNIEEDGLSLMDNVDSAPSSPSLKDSDDLKGADEQAHQAEREEKCLTVKDDVVRVKPSSTPVGAL